MHSKIKNPGVFSQYFRDLGDKVNRKILNRYSMPWMKSKEFDIIYEVLINLNPRSVLEWGSGFSTVMLPNKLKNLKYWHSLEHNRNWYETINSIVDNKKVEVHLVEPDNPDFANATENVSAKKEGIYEDFRSYIEFPGRLRKTFDFIFIDGRARRECLIKASELLNEGGVVIVHDANREAYFQNIPEFNLIFHLQDYRKHRKLGGIWVATNRNSWEGLLRTDLHRKVWKNHDLLAKILFLR